MTKQKSTKRALLLSALSLLMCVSMLIGSTFAWFTDSVTSSGNIIKSGTLDVTMEWADGTKAVPADDSNEWTDASKGAIFNSELWEPGYTEVRHIKIANEGTLALKYQLNIIANGEVSKLADVIDVYYIDPAEEAITDRAQLKEDNKLGTLTDVLANISTTASGNLKADEAHTITLALKMQESAGNEYQNLAIGSDFSIQLLATQLTSEFDSFDDQYDKGAWHPDFTVTSVEDLAAALANGGKIQVNGTLNADGTITVPWNTNRKTEFIIDAETVNELNGGTFILDDEANWGFTVTVDNGETLALSNMNITADSAWVMNMLNQGGTLTLSNIDLVATDGAGVYAYGVNGTTTLNNLNVNHVNLSDPSAPWAATAVATSNGHNLIINGGTYVGSTYGVFVYNSGGKVTINGGTFKAPNVLAADGSYTDPSIRGELYVNGGNFDGKINMTNGYAYCEITGGNFTNFSVSTYSPVVITGGTFDADPSAYVANGYQAVDNGDGTWTVKGYDVSNATELTDAIANGKAVELTQDVSLDKIDLTDAISNDVVINANGHKITTTDAYGIEATSGKNITISNADVVMTKEGDYITYAAGFKIANGDYAGATITLSNCTITMANEDWAYAVNMPASVKNLNLVIDNCVLEGAVAVQCWGDNNTITITDSELICNYTTSAMYTSHCVALQSDGTNVAENNTLVIDNCEFTYSGVDNFDSGIYAVTNNGTNNTITVTDCTYGAKIVAD